jgi:hypothetical protein
VGVGGEREEAGGDDELSVRHVLQVAGFLIWRIFMICLKRCRHWSLNAFEH